MFRWSIIFFTISLNLLSDFSYSEPPKNIPSQLFEKFTMNGECGVSYWYLNETLSNGQSHHWSQREIDRLIDKARKNEHNYYGRTDKYLFEALNEAKLFYNKDVAVIGSVIPWYEAIVLAYDGRPTTVEYNDIICEDDRIKILKPQQAFFDQKKYDLVLSISSIEHDGLGRYGDPINPFGDLQAMNSIKEIMKDEGLLVLAVPIGCQDMLVWNAHRIYGPRRLSKLFDGWEIVKSYGFSNFTDANPDPIYYDYQPIFILKPCR